MPIGHLCIFFGEIFSSAQFFIIFLIELYELFV